MAVYLTKEIKLMIQGITGRAGREQARQFLDCGTNLVAGTSPGKAGESVYGVPVFHTVKDAMEATGANGSVIYVPAPYAKAAAFEALDAGVKLLVIITEHVPVKDTLSIRRRAKETGTVVIGPNCPGLYSPGIGKAGLIPASITSPGRVGIVSRSGTLAFEIAADLTLAGMGQSTIVGIGGDPIPGTSFVDALAAFESDPDTDIVVLVGEIGGSAEEKAAAFIKSSMTKPVFAFIAGRSAPPGKKMGHAGAIIRGSSGTAESKVKALEAAGVTVAAFPADVPKLIRRTLTRV